MFGLYDLIMLSVSPYCFYGISSTSSSVIMEVWKSMDVSAGNMGRACHLLASV